LTIDVVALANEDDLDNVKVEVQILLEESDGAFRFDIGADKTA
jgi:hypothetical protein